MELVVLIPTAALGLISAIRKKFTIQSHFHAISFRVGNPIDVDLKINRTHDAVAELLSISALNVLPKTCVIS